MAVDCAKRARTLGRECARKLARDGFRPLCASGGELSLSERTRERWLHDVMMPK